MTFDAVQILLATITAGVSIAYPALGGTLTELSGVYNIGLEGIMLISAATSFIAALFTGNVFIGLSVGLLTGGLIGAIQALFAVNFRADQVVFGLGIIILGPFLSTFLASTALQSGLRQAPILESLNTSGFPYPFNLILSQNALVYSLIPLVIVLWYVLYKTKLGLAIRSVGENPHVAASSGLNVTLLRYTCSILGCAIAAMGGTFVVLGLSGLWADNVTGGRGFIAIAMIRVGLFKPIWVAIVCILFGLVDSLQLYFSAILGPSFPYQFLGMAPYALGIVVLSVSMVRRTFAEPASLGKPYSREGR
jgi:simple sugar transport system permease protein